MKILFVEDNPKLAAPTALALTREGFLVDLFTTAEDGWLALQATTYDAAVLDIVLASRIDLDPESGLDLLGRVRAAGNATPILLLTALGSVSQRVQGLNAGADDYLVKPFASEELIARLRALGRRPLSMAEDVVRCGNVVYDIAAREVSVGNERSGLSRGESIVLERFLRAPDRVISKDQLGDSLHSLDQDYTENSVRVHVHRVRAKLSDLNASVTIRTLRGLGYMAVSKPPA